MQRRSWRALGQMAMPASVSIRAGQVPAEDANRHARRTASRAVHEDAPTPAVLAVGAGPPTSMNRSDGRSLNWTRVVAFSVPGPVGLRDNALGSRAGASLLTLTSLFCISDSGPQGGRRYSMSAGNHEDSSRRRWWQKSGVLPLARVFVVLVCLSLLATDGWLMWKARQVQLRDAEI